MAVVTATNANGKDLLERQATHEGHIAKEVAFVNRDDGKLTALRVLAGERYVLRLAVTTYGNKEEPAAFLDLVQRLRTTAASAYTKRDTPTFTCVATSVERALSALDGAPLPDALSLS